MGDFASFDWDVGNRAKCQKHGVSISEIERIFEGDPAIAPDRKHSGSEDRYIAIGKGKGNRPMFVAFTYRVRAGAQLVRPVSARYMHKKEAERYEAKGT